MRVKIVLSAIAILLQHSIVSGQSLTAVTDIERLDVGSNSLPGSFRYGRKTMCASTIVGISTMGVGCFGLLLGLGSGMDFSDGGMGSNSTPEQDEARRQRSTNFFIGGGILFAAGAGFLINGIIHDRKYRRFSIVSPKPNQLGLAVNF